MGLPQLLAGLDIEKGHAEENGCEDQHQRILHSKTPDKAGGLIAGGRFVEVSACGRPLAHYMPGMR
jgi:hypothetical protein